MPNWLTPALKWGGIALAVVFAVAVIYVETIASIPEGGGKAVGAGGII